MSRVKRSIHGRKKRRAVLKSAKGFFGARGRLHRLAKESVNRAMAFAYRDRKVRKREFRKLWIVRINAAARANGLSYSALMSGIKKADIALDRKVLADLAVNDEAAFAHIASIAKSGQA